MDKFKYRFKGGILFHPEAFYFIFQVSAGIIPTSNGDAKFLIEVIFCFVSAFFKGLVIRISELVNLTG